MRFLACAIVLSALAAGPALSDSEPADADKAKAASAVQDAPKPSRTVYICADTAETRRAFAREFGKVEFVRAEQAASQGAAWTAPKCITAAEARRLKQLATR